MNTRFLFTIHPLVQQEIDNIHNDLATSLVMHCGNSVVAVGTKQRAKYITCIVNADRRQTTCVRSL